MTLWTAFLDAPLLQVSLAFIAMTAGLFIVAALQHRLRQLTAWVLSALLVASFSMTAITGAITFAAWKNRTALSAAEREALASLAAGDPQSAYETAREVSTLESGSPVAWLTAARSALLLGDLAAADAYYGRLAALPDRELASWNIPGVEDELVQSEKVARLTGSSRRQAAGALAQMVEDHVDEQISDLPGLGKAVENHEALVRIQEELYGAQAEGSAASLDADEVDEGLAGLMGQAGATDARQTRIDALLWQQQWEALVDWLEDDGVQGLMDLADLVLKGSLPDAFLAQYMDTDEDSAAGEMMRTLADNLWSLRSRSGEDRLQLYLTLARLYATDALWDPGRAMELIEEALSMEVPDSVDGLAALRELNSLRLWLEMATNVDQADGMLSQWSGNETNNDEEQAQTTPEPTAEATPAPEETLPGELSGQTVRTDLTPLFNICAPEMIQPGRIRFYVTMAEGSGGFPEGEPTGADFAFRTNIGFQRELNVQSITPAAAIERYTMLLIDMRPDVSAEQIALEKEAALAYVRGMDAGEHILVYKGSLPSGQPGSTYPAGTTQLFGNMEMETYLFSSDQAALEAFIQANYGGDAFEMVDIYQMISWALNQMTAITADSATGSWESFSLTAATPRFGQVIVFTAGDADHRMAAGGPKSTDYVRGAAIAANAAVHIVTIGEAPLPEDLDAIAEAGRGDRIDPSVDDLLAFYNFVRHRQVRVFLADCDLPEDPADEFFELWAQHTPTGVMAGFLRNPGRGVDLVGTLHYSDQSLSSEDFHDYTGGGTDTDTGGGDPFEDDGEDQTDGHGDDGGVTDWPGLDTLRVDGLDRQAIARNDSGLMLVGLLGQGFDGLTPSDVTLTFPGLGTIGPAFIDVTDDSTIHFFLPLTMPTGMYSLRVTIAGHTFYFADTLWVYDADNFTIITFGEWTITAASAQREEGGGDWLLSGAVINDFLHFTGQTRISGDWLTDAADELTFDPGGEAYIAFDTESTDYFVENLFLDKGADLTLGSWSVLTLKRSGAGTAFSSRQWGDVMTRPISLGLVDMPYDTGTLYPDRVEIPIVELNLDLPLQEYLFMATDLLSCSATAEATFTADTDSIDLALTAGLEADNGLKFMGALTISEFSFEIDTAQRRIAVDLGVKLVGDDGFKAHLALKGDMLDEITVSVETSIPVTTTPPSPIPVTIAELGGGLENLSAIGSDDPADILGVTLMGLATLEAGKATDLIPFLSSLSWLPADKIPAMLATDDTSLKLRPWPFSLAFSTDVKLFDAFPVGHAELSIGYYAFEQALLGISDDEAVGLHALIAVGPDIDFSIVRLGYSAGTGLDINDHGFFLSSNGAAWFGINLGCIGFTSDMNGTFLVAVHGIEDSDWPQVSIVVNAAPTAGIPGLWSAGEVKDVRLLINEHGFRVIGIPSPLDSALEWLDGQINTAANETWEAVTAGMDAMEDAAEMAWDLLGDGIDLVGAGADAMVDAMTDGLGTLYDTGEDVLEDVGDFLESAGDAAGEAWGDIVDFAQDGYSGFESTADGAYNFLTGLF